MIPDEAVEAAIEALLGSKLGDHAGINGEEFVEAARLALEAAAPHLMAGAWEAGWQAGAGWPQKESNPYKAVAAAFEAGEYTDRAGQRWIKSADGWVFDDNAGGVWVTTPEVLAAKISEEANAV